MLGFLWAFYWLLYELLGLVSQDFSADWMARKRESQPVLGKARNKKAFKSIAPSLPCYIGKLVHNLEKFAGLQAPGKQRRLSTAADTETGDMETRAAAGEGKRIIPFPFCP